VINAVLPLAVATQRLAPSKFAQAVSKSATGPPPPEQDHRPLRNTSTISGSHDSSH
jgi:hypothetical protein